MRFGFSILGCGGALLVLGCGAYVPDLQAQGVQRSTRSASSSETNSLEIFSTLKGLDVKKDGLRQPDDELSKSLEPFTSRQSMDAVVPSTYQAPRLPVSKSLRSKEDLEKSRGWVWDAEEVMSGRSREDSSSFPGFTSKSGSDQKKSSWDRYSDQTRPERSANRGSQRDSQSWNESEAGRNSDSDDDDIALAGGVGRAAKNLKVRLEKESVGVVFKAPPSFRNSVSDFFGQPIAPPPTAAQVEAHKAYMDEFQKVIGGPVADSPNMDFFKSAAVPVLTGNSQGLDSLPGSSRRDGLAFTAGMTPAAVVPTTVPDPNSSVLNQWNPMYTPPKLDLPKPAPFFPPVVEIPRRKF